MYYFKYIKNIKHTYLSEKRGEGYYSSLKNKHGCSVSRVAVVVVWGRSNCPRKRAVSARFRGWQWWWCEEEATALETEQTLLGFEGGSGGGVRKKQPPSKTSSVCSVLRAAVVVVWTRYNHPQKRAYAARFWGRVLAKSNRTWKRAVYARFRGLMYLLQSKNKHKKQKKRWAHLMPTILHLPPYRVHERCWWWWWWVVVSDGGEMCGGVVRWSGGGGGDGDNITKGAGLGSTWVWPEGQLEHELALSPI